MKGNRNRTSSPATSPRLGRKVICLLAALAAAPCGAGLAATLSNSAGATVEIVTTEADAGMTLTNSTGATLEMAATDQASLDSIAPSQARLYVGLLDPYLGTSNAAGKLWALYE